MSISVVIATFNRARLLAECLEHLTRQSFVEGDEVLVIDNGSTDETRSIVAAAAVDAPVPFRYLFEPVPGKSAALARGLDVAAGDILAFCDDDVNVAPTWLSAVRETMADPQVALMGGPVAARWERVPPSWLRGVANGRGRLASPLALLNYGPGVVELGPRTVLGANMATRRQVVARIGGFAPHLGKLRGTLLTGEDHDFCRRAQQAGLRAIYQPTAIVYHWIPAERMRLAYYISWFYWSGVTHAALDHGQPVGRSIFGVPLYLVRRAATSSVGAATSALTGDVCEAVERLVDVAFSVGYAAGRWHRPHVPRVSRVSPPALTARGDRV
jgi:glycosyltransferase involved in cell wall biosynthesis